MYVLSGEVAADPRISVERGALARGTTVDRGAIAGLGAAHDNQPGYRSQGGWPSQAGVNGVGTALISSTSSKAPRTSTMNSSPASTVIVGGVRVLTEKRVFGPICAHVLLPCASQTPGAIPAQGLGTVRSR
jgi:hypothetical protein